MVHIVWEFRVKPDRVAEFEQHYSSHGTWAALFRKSPKYYGTVLTQDLADPTRYLLTDLWESAEALDEFKRVNLTDYDALDKKCEALTMSEVKVGAFQKLD